MPKVWNAARGNDETPYDLSASMLRTRVQILPLDTAYSQARFQVITPDNKRFEIDNSARCLLDYLQKPRTTADLLAAAERERWQFGGATIDFAFIQEQLLKRGLVELCGLPIDSDDRAIPKPMASGGRYTFLWLHYDIFERAMLQPVTRILAVLFSHVGILLGVLFTIVTHALLLDSLWRTTTPVTPSAEDWWILVGILYGSVLWHELGHAAACERFGAEHGPIGVGLFLVYPVMYCNVTDTWKLSRTQRITVDIAGIYFHCLFASVFCILALRHPSPLLFWVVASVWGMIMFNLNPFFKFDGYWVLSDLLGISSLHRISTVLWRRTLLLNRDPRAYREIRELPRKIRLTVFSYSAVYAVAMAYFAERIVCWIVPRFVSLLTKDLPKILLRIEAKQFDAILLAQVFQLLLVLLFAYGGLLFLTTGIIAIFRALRKT